MQQILQQRLARLLIDAGKAEEALPVLGDADDPASLEVRGDDYVALDKLEEARKQYFEVLARLDIASPGRRLVELKVSDRGRSHATPAAPLGENRIPQKQA